jgi:hypothetical protein
VINEKIKNRINKINKNNITSHFSLLERSGAQAAKHYHTKLISK